MRKHLLMIVLLLALRPTIAMSIDEEFEAERKANPRGAQAAFCFAFAMILLAEEPEGKPPDKTTSLVIERSVKQGIAAYGDDTLFRLKSSSVVTRFMQNVRVLQRVDPAGAYSVLASMRKQVLTCSKALL